MYLDFSPYMCRNVMNLVEEVCIDSLLEMKSTNYSFFFPIKWAPGSPLLSLHSFPAADLFAHMHLPCVTDTVNNLLNGMQNLTFAGFWLPFWLVTHQYQEHAICFSCYPLGPSPSLLHFPYLVRVSICLAIFSIPSRFWQEDLTFK